MTVSIYVYYRVDASRTEAARNAVERILEEMRRSCSRARLMVRAGESLLWMEVYEDVVHPVGFERDLDDAVHRHGLQICLAPGQRRHMETFLAQCA